MCRNKIPLIVIIPVLAAAGAVFCFIFYSSPEKAGILEIRDANSARVFAKWPLEELDEFTIEFIHSVNQSPVRETFRIDSGKLHLDNVRFSSYGAGIQSDLTEGLDLIMDGDAMTISGFDYSFKEFNLIVGTVSDHILFINNEIISLRELCGRNTHITIQYR